MELNETEEPIHPTYGTLDNLLKEIKEDIKNGCYVRIGRIDALDWFVLEYFKLKIQKC